MRASVETRSRISLVVAAVRLSSFTVVWNVVTGGLALAASVIVGGLSLGGFGLNTLIDTTASVVLVVRFTKEASNPLAADRLETRAEVAIGLAMFGVAAYLTVQGIHALVNGAHPTTSRVGIGVTVASLIVLPVLARAKMSVASRLQSRALRGDAILTAASAVLAGLTLAALLVNSLWNWWWADAIAALVIAAALGLEATRAFTESRRGRS
jgi:divalent metal cation (Fe/Co/Zn/Cd) transporter